jgi:hypothetical protein
MDICLIFGPLLPTTAAAAAAAAASWHQLLYITAFIYFVGHVVCSPLG